MIKELEILERIIEKTGCMNDTCAHLGNCLKDNKCRYNDDNLMCPDYEMANTIKQALTKAQEQEKENARYKQLEEQLGCPLDVVERALMNGIYINGQEGLCIVHRYVKMLIVNQYLSVWIKDYKKTWWLKEDKSE